MSAPLPDNALLRQLQQRLTHLAQVTDSEQVSVIQALIAELYHAQQQANGVLAAADVQAQLSVTLADLRRDYPMLIGDAEAPTPIVVFAEFIAFRRIYQQLRGVVNELRRRNTLLAPSESALSRISWQSHFTLSDEQTLAVFTAAALPLCVITGGAGTGKTTTLTKALELIMLDNPDSDIFLAAPTGKAAQRLNESLAQQLDYVDDSVRDTLGQLRAKTLHRLLAVSERTGRALHHADNPLCCDVLVIDEASMIGSDLLAQTLAALPAHAKLILLGDANQLPPIQSVAFFNEISKLNVTYDAEFAAAVQNGLAMTLVPEQTNHKAKLNNALCRLTIARRFAQQSLIERCADAVLQRDSNALINVLGNQLLPMPQAESLYQQLLQTYPINREGLLAQLPQRMILCANRQGTYGSEALNTRLDSAFRQILSIRHNDTWYSGRQILIEKNHPDLQLSNGDIGYCFAQNGQWLLDFGDNRVLPVDLLPSDYSLAFAISIHKSQGSEYAHVDMVLDRFDPQQPNPLVSAELIYTGITRARQSLMVFADNALIQQALSGDASESASPLIALLKSFR